MTIGNWFFRNDAQHNENKNENRYLQMQNYFQI